MVIKNVKILAVVKYEEIIKTYSVKKIIEEQGKAVFIMLDNDIMTASAAGILKIKPICTYVGYKKVFGK